MENKLGLADTVMQIASAGPSYEVTVEAIAEILCALRHYADAHGLIFAAAQMQADRDYMGDLAGEDGEGCSLRYSGWDQRHDDNKAQGRPIGNQWSDRRVDYSSGYKVHR